MCVCVSVCEGGGLGTSVFSKHFNHIRNDCKLNVLCVFLCVCACVCVCVCVHSCVFVEMLLVKKDR